MDIKSFLGSTQIYLFMRAAAYEGIKWPADSLTSLGSLQPTFAINKCVFKHKCKYLHTGCYKSHTTDCHQTYPHTPKKKDT